MVDYWAIEEALVSVLDKGLPGVTVVAEDVPRADVAPVVCVFLNGRTPAPGQPIAAGRRWAAQIDFSVWAYVTVANDLATGARVRDELVTKIEAVLAGNRTLNGKVDTLFLEGGQFETIKVKGVGFIIGGEVKVRIDYTGAI